MYRIVIQKELSTKIFNLSGDLEKFCLSLQFVFHICNAGIYMCVVRICMYMQANNIERKYYHDKIKSKQCGTRLQFAHELHTNVTDTNIKVSHIRIYTGN